MRTDFTVSLVGLIRLGRYGITGLLGTCIHVVIAVALIQEIHTTAYLANAIAFCVATGFSYLVNTRWSFTSQVNHQTLRRYMSVATLGCFLTVLISASAEYLQLDYLIGILLVILIVTPITFLLHKHWTYHSIQRLEQC